MFRSLMEAFSDNMDSGPAAKQLDFISQQEDLYKNVYPNLVPIAGETQQQLQTPQVQQQLRNIGTVVQPVTGSISQPITNTGTVFKSMDIPESLRTMQQQCIQTPLDVLSASQNPAQTNRCGWIYKNGEASTGFLGTQEGPVSFFNPPTGKWYWNLKDAEKDINIDRCAKMTDCKTVDAREFANRCAWCPSLGVGIPINSAGTPLYPNDVRTACMDVAPIRSAANCPVPTPPIPGTAAAAVLEEKRAAVSVCTPLSDGSVSRKCIMDQLTAAKCSTNGTLYIALQNSVEPANYLGTLERTPAFIEYQKRATTILPVDTLRNGKIGANAALNTFTELYKATTRQAQASAAVSAARDLCLQSGEFDTFDFCSELQPTTPGPFSLSCLQNEFKRAGGQPAGSAYPSPATQQQWNAIGTWGAVQQAIQRFVDNTKSKDLHIQRQALKALLGIERDARLFAAVPEYKMYDTLWFIGENRIGETPGRVLYGRRTYDSTQSFGFTAQDSINGLPFNHLFFMIMMGNMRTNSTAQIKWRFVTDDRGAIVLNRFGPTMNEWNTSPVRNEIGLFYRWYDQGPTQHTSETMELTNGSRNFVKFMWTERFGVSVFSPSISINNGDFVPIPANSLTLNQELDAPYVSFQVMTRPSFAGNRTIWQEYRNPEVFYFTRMTGIQYETSRPNYAGVPGKQPFMRLTGTTSVVELGTPILPVAWKTITVAFRLDNRLPANRATLLTVGPGIIVTLVYEGSSIYANFAGQRIPHMIKQDEWYLLAVSQIPNERRISISIQSFNGGSPTVINAQNVYLNQSFSIVGESIVNPHYGLLTLGGANTAASISVAWVHIFDRIFTSEMVRKEMANEWLRDWVEV